MKCNPWRWLWGLLPLALVALIVNVFERPRIEADLGARTLAALNSSGLGWAAAGFDRNGRDGLVSGQAAEEIDQQRVISTIKGVWGVRSIDNRSTLLDKAERYAWSANRLGNKLTLRGLAPSEPDRRTILAMAKASIPGLEIEDKMRLARGVPDKQDWLGGVDFSLRQLAQLRRGRADLDGMALTLSGEAPTPAAYKQVKADLSRLPKGVKLKHERINPPMVTPYVWEAAYDGRQVVVSGYAPSEKVRDALLQDVAKRLPGKAVVDRLEIGGGAPRDFERTLDLALSQVARLESGGARLTDTQLVITGSAAEEVTKEAIAKAVRGVPAPYRGSESVTFRIPKIAPVSPYVTTSSIEVDSLVVGGHVPSEDARRALLAFARAQHPGLKLVDKTVLATGEPDVWLTCSQAGLKALQRLGKGRFELRDRAYLLAGETSDESLHRALPGELRSTVPSGCQGETQVALTEDPRRLDEARRRAEEDARRRTEDEARRRAEDEARRRAEEEARRQAAIQPPPRPAPSVAPPQVTVDTCQLSLNDVVKSGVIQFGRGEADLNAESYPTLDRLAEAANRCPGLRIEVGGHTDARGSSELNRRLSEARAVAVTNYLVSRGVAEGRLIAVGYGPSRPVAPNDTDENRARNRRIEFIVKEQ